MGFNSGPPIAPAAYNQNVQIFQTPNTVVLLNEMVHNARLVPLDGRPHGTARSASGPATRVAGGPFTETSLSDGDSLEPMPSGLVLTAHSHAGLSETLGSRGGANRVGTVCGGASLSATARRRCDWRTPRETVVGRRTA